MPEALDRRAFLVAVGAAGASLASGCGTTHRSHKARSSRLLSKPAKTLAHSIRGRVFTPGSPGYVNAAHVYNESFDWVRPKAIARPLDAKDVQAAVNWAAAAGEHLRARSGGHSYAGYSTIPGGVVLDLRHLNRISVDRRARTATVGSGCQLIDVYRALAAHGATIPAGSCPSVGIAGHALGGGMGLAGRNFGLAADSLIAARIVTADGASRTVSAATDPDLLWALRGGGGGNFGVATQLTFRIHPVPASAAYFFVNWPWSSAAEAIQAWTRWAPHATQLATSVLHVNGGSGSTSVSVSGQYFGPSSAAAAILGPLRNIPGAAVTVGDQDYFGLMLRWAGCLGKPLAACHTAGAASGGALERARFDAKSDYLRKPLSAAGANAVVDAVQQRAALPGPGAMLFDAYGGAINRVHPSATAFVHRDELACIQYLSYDGGAGWLNQAWSAMRPYVSGEAYQNYIDATLKGWQRAYYGANYPRLQQVRNHLDPHHFFTFPQAIGR